jgi:hypothetical protein
VTRSTLPFRSRRRLSPPRRLLTLSIGRRAWYLADREQRRIAADAVRALLKDLERGYTPRQAVARAYVRRKGR